MLFVLMKPGKKFSQRLVNDIKVAIRKELSPRHVPKYVFETPEIPVSNYRIVKAHCSPLTFPDHRQPQKSRIAGEADHIRQNREAEWNSSQSAESGLLLQICKGRGAGKSAKGEAVMQWSAVDAAF
jgi:hypothetical protein